MPSLDRPSEAASRQHGIGNYSLQQFSNALRGGIRGDGAHLYPAMPYASYARLTDDDIKPCTPTSCRRSSRWTHQRRDKRRCHFPTTCASQWRSGMRCSSTQSRSRQIRRSLLSGTAANIWWTARRIAANATHRAASSCSKSTARNSVAPSSDPGMRPTLRLVRFRALAQ